jgi:hypothetical protein
MRSHDPKETLINVTHKFDLRLFASLAIPWILLGFLPWAVWPTACLAGLAWRTRFRRAGHDNQLILLFTTCHLPAA